MTRFSLKKLYQSNSEIFSIWLVWRIVLIVIAVYAANLYPRAGPYPLVPDPVVPTKTIYTSTLDPWLERAVWGWSNYDGKWYVSIANQGYFLPGANAFYPLYPMLMRGVGLVLGLGNPDTDIYKLAGVIISSMATLALIGLLYKLAEKDYDIETARLSVIYLLVFPTAFYLGAVYTEALFLALAVGAFYAARKERWLLALFLAALAVLSKNQGIFVAAALLVEFWQQKEWDWRKLFERRIFYFGLPVLAVASWLLFNALTFGSPFAFMTSTTKYWGRGFRWPWETVGLGILGGISSDGNIPLEPMSQSDVNVFYLDLSATLFFCWMIIVAIRTTLRGRLRASYLIFALLCLLQPLSSPSTLSLLNSMPRYFLVIFPVFLLLGRFGKKHRWFHYSYLAICLPLWGLLIARFTLGYWVA